MLKFSPALLRPRRNRLAGNRTRSLRMKASDAGRYTTSRSTSTRDVRSRFAAHGFACMSTDAFESSHRPSCGWRDSNPHGRSPHASEARSSASFRHNRDPIRRLTTNIRGETRVSAVRGRTRSALRPLPCTLHRHSPGDVPSRRPPLARRGGSSTWWVLKQVPTGH